MKIPWTAVLFTAATSWCVSNLNATTNKKHHWRSTSETLIKQRIQNLKLPFNVNYESEIGQQIKSYVVYGKRSTEKMLSRSTRFFPIFEHHLKINHLPLELRFLPMIESQLKPTIKSPVGAAGLWQFVPATARLYGIKMNVHLDERFDPHRSTEAAVRLLKKLYAEYCDWALVLAAYNCGTVRVNKAIKEANSTNYEDIKGFLPQETQRYLPRFVAAAYVCNYYEAHGLMPKPIAYDANQVQTVKINESITFDEIQDITKLDEAVIRRLNPSYLSGTIPASRRGNYLALPKMALKKVADYIQQNRKSAATDPSSAFPHDYIVQSGDTIEKIAYEYGCDKIAIMRWNELSSPTLSFNQQIKLFLTPQTRWEMV